MQLIETIEIKHLHKEILKIIKIEPVRATALKVSQKLDF